MVWYGMVNSRSRCAVIQCEEEDYHNSTVLVIQYNEDEREEVEWVLV